MAIEKIHIEQFLELSKTHPVIDVRSPGEYKHAHMPGSYSLPLFTDEERATVGTAYKQQSREQAIKIGLDFFGPKMRKMVEEVEEIVGSRESGVGSLPAGQTGQESIVKTQSIGNSLATNDSRLILTYCWRGGMRSAGVAWLLDLYGFKVYTLIGGYKSFRNYVLHTFQLPFQFNIVGGYTGSGKTTLLKTLKEKGESVIDLEGIANHKGSAFGNIGLPAQPSQEMFENLLSNELRKQIVEKNAESSKAPFRGLGGTWLEDESQRIGLINIPSELWKLMRRSPVYFLEIPFEERLNQIVQEYGQLDQEQVILAIERISQKLGNFQAKMAILHLKEGKKAESFDILLKYYDKHYLKGLHNREGLNSLLYTVKCNTVTPENASQLLLKNQYQSQKC